MKFKKGDKVAIRVNGAGVVSYEPHVVEYVRGGIVKLVDNDDFKFSAETSRRINDSSAFGFSFSLVHESEVPQ